MESVGVFAIAYVETIQIFHSRFIQNVEYVYEIGNSTNYLVRCLADKSVICKNFIQNSSRCTWANTLMIQITLILENN